MSNNIEDNKSNNNNHDQQIDLDSLRNNFISIEYFNLEQKLKHCLQLCKNDTTDILARIEKLQPKLAERSFPKKEHMQTSLKKYALYVRVIDGHVSNLYDDIDNYYNSELSKDLKNKAKAILTEISEETEIKPYKKRNPKPIPKPKKPRDMDTDMQDQNS